MEFRTNSKIQAIKLLREKSGLGLKDAKDVVDIIESHLQQNAAEPLALRAENKRLLEERDCARADLLSTIRLVGYFVKHPAEFEAHMAQANHG